MTTAHALENPAEKRYATPVTLTALEELEIYVRDCRDETLMQLIDGVRYEQELASDETTQLQRIVEIHEETLGNIADLADQADYVRSNFKASYRKILQDIFNLTQD